MGPKCSLFSVTNFSSVPAGLSVYSLMEEAPSLESLLVETIG